MTDIAMPPPEEIAGLITEMEWFGANVEDARWPGLGASCATAAAALRSQAQEVERLEDSLNRQKARTEEEAELRGNALNDLDTAQQRIRELEDERDAIWAKTIEECLKTKVTVTRMAIRSDDYLHGFEDGARAQIDAIRALAQPQEEAKK